MNIVQRLNFLILIGFFFPVHPILQGLNRPQNNPGFRSAETGEVVTNGSSGSSHLSLPMLTIPPPPSTPPPPIPSRLARTANNNSGVSNVRVGKPRRKPDYENVNSTLEQMGIPNPGNQIALNQGPRSPGGPKPVLARYQPVLQTNYESGETSPSQSQSTNSIISSPSVVKKKVVIIEAWETPPVSPVHKSPPAVHQVPAPPAPPPPLPSEPMANGHVQPELRPPPPIPAELVTPPAPEPPPLPEIGGQP